jgi:hypothetical protein
VSRDDDGLTHLRPVNQLAETRSRLFDIHRAHIHLHCGHR